MISKNWLKGLTELLFYSALAPDPQTLLPCRLLAVTDLKEKHRTKSYDLHAHTPPNSPSSYGLLAQLH